MNLEIIGQEVQPERKYTEEIQRLSSLAVSDVLNGRNKALQAELSDPNSPFGLIIHKLLANQNATFVNMPSNRLALAKEISKMPRTEIVRSIDQIDDRTKLIDNIYCQLDNPESVQYTIDSLSKLNLNFDINHYGLIVITVNRLINENEFVELTKFAKSKNIKLNRIDKLRGRSHIYATIGDDLHAKNNQH